VKDLKRKKQLFLSSRNLTLEEIADCDDKELKERLCTRAYFLGALQFGEFKLAGGAESDYYFDGRLLSLDPHGACLIAEWLWRQISARDDIDALGGPAVSSVPIVGALVYRASREEIGKLGGFFVRDAAKKHGTQNLIEGPIKPPMRLMVIDDTVTTGGSLMRAIKTLREHDYIVDRAAAIVDRGERTPEEFEKIDVEFTAALSLEDLKEPTSKNQNSITARPTMSPASKSAQAVAASANL